MPCRGLPSSTWRATDPGAQPLPSTKPPGRQLAPLTCSLGWGPPVGHGVVLAQRGQHEEDGVLGAAGGVAGAGRRDVGHPDAQLRGLQGACRQTVQLLQRTDAMPAAPPATITQPWPPGATSCRRRRRPSFGPCPSSLASAAALTVQMSTPSTPTPYCMISLRRGPAPSRGASRRDMSGTATSAVASSAGIWARSHCTTCEGGGILSSSRWDGVR